MTLLRPSLPSLRSVRTLLALLVVVSALATACGSDGGVGGGDDAVASVGGTTLTEDDLRLLLAGGGDPPATADVQATADTIGQWLFLEAVLAELAERGFPLTDDDLAVGREAVAAAPPPEGLPEPGSRLDELLVRFGAVPHLAARWLEEGEGVVPSNPALLCSSHILVETEEEAQAAIDRYNNGEDFADLARELSTGPSGPDGGDLGCVDPAGFVPEFVAGAEKVDPPGISEPTESQFGWHVIYVDSFEQTEFVDAAQRDNAILLAAPELVQELQQTAAARDDIELAEKYGTWDPATGRVAPPSG